MELARQRNAVTRNTLRITRSYRRRFLEVTKEELKDTGAFVIVDSPDEITFAHVDALYKQLLSNKLRKDVGKALMTAANRRGPAYIPKQ